MSALELPAERVFLGNSETFFAPAFAGFLGDGLVIAQPLARCPAGVAPARNDGGHINGAEHLGA
jgi:hypothetical protein